ncbi:RDD family protein [Propioniciclava soli]|uniref:RDD family protein n=1 Tax=Propioniciclava soli TaxID=2775081 RepID=A0ABZ3C4P2_9ACTN
MSGDEPLPGASLGLPAQGRGSLASWPQRVLALALDWAASMIVAVGVFGTGVLTDQGWRAWMILAVFFVEKALLTALTGSSFGQLLAGVGVTRTDRSAVGWWRPVVRAALICLVLPALVIGAERRSLADLALGTVVVRRR